jgi:hypothetical protein
MDGSVKLSVFQGRKNFFEARSGRIAKSFEVVTCEETRRPDLFGGSLCQEAPDEVIGAQVSMARQAIEPVQFEVLIEMVEAHEPLQGGELHLAYVFEAQMIRNKGGNLGRVVIGEAQAAADVFRHARAHFHVLIESDAAIWP